MNRSVAILKALGDGTRFHIIGLLLKYDLCVGALAHHLGISKAAVSQHLQILRKAGLVKGEKRGYWTHYSVEKEVIHEATNDLLEMTNQVPGPEDLCFRGYQDKKILCGKEVEKMCKCQCEHPDKLRGKPGECSPVQIKECHGDVKEHPCETKKE